MTADLDTALAAADRGWRVFPLRPGDKRPAVDSWETRATTEPDRIRAAWTAGRYGVGIAAGPSGLLVLDLDTPKPGQPPPAGLGQGITCGQDVLAAVCETAGHPYPQPTYTVRTARGGLHHYYRAPADHPENVRPLHADVDQPAPVDPLTQAWTADALMAIAFSEPKWAVPGVIPEGAALLAGPPKIGKSWLSLGAGIAVASGSPALGDIAVDAGPVLYLALEDTPRRLQRRMGKILAGQPAPAGLTLATTCPPLPDGGDAAIARWLTRHPDARLVIIDAFAKMRGTPPPGMSAYEADYAAVGRAKRLADDFGVALVLVHHVRKAAADDFLSEVSGTNGMAGAADTVLVLKRSRGTADGVLHATGRDIDETERAMAFDTNTGTWRILDGPATDHAVGDTRALILTYVRDHPGARPKDISNATGADRDLIRRTCTRMATDGQLHRDGEGRYYQPIDPLGQPNGPGTVPGVPGVPPPP